MQNRLPPWNLLNSNFYPIGPNNTSAQSIPPPVFGTYHPMQVNVQQEIFLAGGLQQRLAQVNQTLALANQEVKQTEKRLESSMNANTDNSYPVSVLINPHTIVDQGNWVFVNNSPSSQVAEEVTQHNREVDNSEQIYIHYVEVVQKGRGSRRMKQLVDPKNYEGDQNDIMI